MSHADQVSKLPKNFKVIASSKNSKFAIVENKSKKFYGVQFHPEVTHTENGKKLISNFLATNSLPYQPFRSLPGVAWQHLHLVV